MNEKYLIVFKIIFNCNMYYNSFKLYVHSLFIINLNKPNKLNELKYQPQVLNIRINITLLHSVTSKMPCINEYWN